MPIQYSTDIKTLDCSLLKPNRATKVGAYEPNTEEGAIPVIVKLMYGIRRSLIKYMSFRQYSVLIGTSKLEVRTDASSTMYFTEDRPVLSWTELKKKNCEDWNKWRYDF